MYIYIYICLIINENVDLTRKVWFDKFLNCESEKPRNGKSTKKKKKKEKKSRQNIKILIMMVMDPKKNEK